MFSGQQKQNSNYADYHQLSKLYYVGLSVSLKFYQDLLK